MHELSPKLVLLEISFFVSGLSCIALADPGGGGGGGVQGVQTPHPTLDLGGFNPKYKIVS